MATEAPSTTNITLAVETELLDAIDSYCDAKRRATGDRPSRAAVARMALFQFLRMNGNSQAKEPPPAAT